MFFFSPSSCEHEPMNFLETLKVDVDYLPNHYNAVCIFFSLPFSIACKLCVKFIWLEEESNVLEKLMNSLAKNVRMDDKRQLLHRDEPLPDLESNYERIEMLIAMWIAFKINTASKFKDIHISIRNRIQRKGNYIFRAMNFTSECFTQI